MTLKKVPWRDPAEVFRAVLSREGVVWLDSALHMGDFGRWSYILTKPYKILRGKNGVFSVTERGETREFHADPFTLLDELLRERQPLEIDNGPPFTGGAVGYLGYGLLRHAEPSAVIKPRSADEGDLWLGFYDSVIAFDHEKLDTWVVAPENEYDELCSSLSSAPEPSPDFVPREFDLSSNFTREEYIAAVEKVRRYIERGDCYQVNIAQRFTATTRIDPQILYYKLRAASPAPFAAYIDAGDARVLSSSPELFLQVRDGRILSRPIKGTRPRGADAEADTALKAELFASEKDRAENVMIVDLLRNDLSRVSRPDTVKVPSLCEIEAFSTVFHMTSTIAGELKPGVGVSHILRAAFPCGSVTGAPKIRAMEIIDEIEPHPRGVYCGAIGYIGFDGSMDLSVAIRVMIHNDGIYNFYAGGGVTYPSVAEEEYQETLDKAKAMIEVITK